jgi:hypothetical protein
LFLLLNTILIFTSRLLLIDNIIIIAVLLPEVFSGHEALLFIFTTTLPIIAEDSIVTAFVTIINYN